MTPGGRARDLLAAAVLAGAAVWFTVLWMLSPPAGPAGVSFDVYQYYLPNLLYAVGRLHEGGTGLLWNAYQHCGQPFFGISSTGLLYPLNLLYLILNPGAALRTVTVLNFLIAGIGMYALCRELGVGRAPALLGATAFELGTATTHLSVWGPQMAGPWVWLPTSMLFCERLLRRPRLSDSICLGAALGVSLLPGFPHVVFFAYQLIALRVLFECVVRRDRHAFRSASATGLGLLLAPLLVAAALLPAVETARSSVRGGRLSLDEIRAGGFMTWEKLRGLIAFRMDFINPFIFIPSVVASASWVARRTRRLAIFYTSAGLLFLALGFGPGTPLFGLYLRLPLGAFFREPMRFMWMTSFCLAVLTALGAEALVAQAERPPWSARAALLACTAATLVGLHVLLLGLRPSEWVLGGAVVLGAALGGLGRSARRAALVLVIGAPLLGVLGYSSKLLPPLLSGPRMLPVERLLPNDGQMFFAHAALFGALRARMTPQDRIYIVHRHAEFSLMPKSAALFGVASAQDYEPQASRRAAEYVVRMRSGGAMENLNQYYIDLLPRLSRHFSRPLLDLAAVRYLVVDPGADNVQEVLDPPPTRVSIGDDPGAVVYENRQALPRAQWVPGARVIAAPEAVLAELAEHGASARQSVLLEEAPPSGFLGTDAGEGDEGQAEFLLDDPEHLIIRVRAPARGFLRLADEDLPGWSATLNCQPAHILRADFLFRAVEVPMGESTVEFRYAPPALAIGAAISVLTVLAAGGYLLWKCLAPQYLT